MRSMKIKSRFIHKENRFVILFLSLIATIILPALSPILSEGLTDLVSAICFSGIVVAGYIWDSEERRDHALGLILVRQLSLVLEQELQFLRMILGILYIQFLRFFSLMYLNSNF